MMSEILETPLGRALLKRSSRKTLAISVLPDGSLELAAPESASEEAILAKVLKRKRWIANQRLSFREMNITPVPRRYVSGATHRYLGRQYRLKVSVGPQASVSLKGGYFYVTAPDLGSNHVEGLLKKWFRAKAREQFSRRLEKWSDWCRKRHLPEPRLRLLTMPKRWGSAARDGRIALNPELIHAPAPCVDYVITHEICHLKHPAHDRAFYRQLTILLPQWRDLKARLEGMEFT